MAKEKKWLAVEIFGVFIILIAQIWLGYKISEFLAVIPIGMIFISWWVRRECGKTRQETVDLFAARIGFLPSTMKSSGRILIFALATAAIFISIGLIFNPYLNLPTTPTFWERTQQFLIYYLGWATFQHILYQGYLINRLQQLFENTRITQWLGGAMFAVIHAPGPILLISTFIWGIISANFFLKNRNIWIIAIAHAIMAVSLETCLPYAWHNNLAIGPSYFNW